MLLAVVRANTSQNLELIRHPISSCFVTRTSCTPFVVASGTFTQLWPLTEGLLTVAFGLGLVVDYHSFVHYLPSKSDFHFE